MLTLKSITGALLSTLLVCQTLSASEGSPANFEDTAKLRGQILDMKAAERGPFRRLRWFCKDGSVLPPKAYACADHGGGVQHGQWSDTVEKLRASGFLLGNVLASADVQQIQLNDDEQLQAILVEKFLIKADDGWIFRKARFYRGALQAEDELAAAKKLLETLTADTYWQANNYLLLLETSRYLPHSTLEADTTNPTATVAQVRAEAANLNDKDPGFDKIRNKIHGSMDAFDAQRVRTYAQTASKPELRPAYEALARGIDQIFAGTQLQLQLSAIAKQLASKSLAGELEAIGQIATETNSASTDLREGIAFIKQASQLQERLREQITAPQTTGSNQKRQQLKILNAIVAIDQAIFIAAQQLMPNLETASRQSLVALLTHLARSAYGTGLLNAFQLSEIERSTNTLKNPQITLGNYQQLLATLARVPTWAQRGYTYVYGPAVEKFTSLESLAADFIPDRLRGSVILSYSRVLDVLAEDAARNAGISHTLFGKQVATGVHSLNPGVAEGVLQTLAAHKKDPNPGVPVILIVPETLADLPPVAGILTENEGNQLSHVQLLARNLGIPNVVVGADHLSEIKSHVGASVALAASPAGVVQLTETDAAEFRAKLVERTPNSTAIIKVNYAKLQLDDTQPTSVSALRSEDSGVRVGPKAAKLGELNARYPGQVSAALAIPFGSFRALLDQPFEDTQDSAFDWLKKRYVRLDEITDAQKKRTYRNETLQQIRSWIARVKLDDQFVDSLRTAMTEQFGPDGSYGVFVRSDTNVEDLPGFTGAGLNLTVPNVVGFDEVVSAIRRVWASPFTERAFGWRQALMDKPEHLYVAVLLHQGVNSEKSGVLVTTDITGDESEAYTVVTNEGVSGGVDGQSAEMLLVSSDRVAAKLFSSATAPYRRVLLAQGGSELRRARAPERLITAANVKTLNAFVENLNSWFIEEGKPVVADVEFGFIEDKLVLFQIRPFVENNSANQNTLLQQLDQQLAQRKDTTIDLKSPAL